MKIHYSHSIKKQSSLIILTMFGFRCSSCETVLHGIEKQIERSNNYRDIKASQQTKFECEVCS